jgi:hypothetical protein
MPSGGVVKQGEPLPRYTPLARKTPMRRSGWKREGGSPARTPHPSPSKRERDAAERKAERWAKNVLKVRSGGWCECCGQAEATNFSHREGKGVGGIWTPANGLHACGWGNLSGCHGRIHQNPKWARDEMGWRLKSHEDPLAMPALLARWGWVLLDDEGGMVQLSAVEASALLHPP